VKETAEVARSLDEELPACSDGWLGEHDRSEMMPDLTEAEDAYKIFACTGPMRSENDALLERMQAPEVRAAARRAFNASTNELRKAAMEAARSSEGCSSVRP
jgi:hypothetical protein